jgi:hypothetical protein
MVLLGLRHAMAPLNRAQPRMLDSSLKRKHRIAGRFKGCYSARLREAAPPISFTAAPHALPMRLNSPSTGGKERWHVFLAISFLVAVPLILFSPVLLFDKMIYGFDVLTCHIPYRTEIERSLALRQWPMWMPDILGGMPGIAACNLYFLYPSDLISTLAGCPVWTQLGLDAVLHVALAGIGMFLLLRRLDRSVSGSLLGAFIFAVSGSQISLFFGGYYCFVEGVALVPWAFWAAHKGLKEASWFAWGLCGLAFALQILAQATQLFAYTLPAVAAFVLALDWNRSAAGGAAAGPKARMAARLPALQGLALALGLAFLLAAPQLVPTLQYLPLCTRHGYTHAEFVGGSIGLSEALSWLVPGFFGWRIPTYHGALAGSTCVTEYFGLLPWALASGALFALWRREPLVRWMAALALTAFFFAQRQWTPFYFLFRHLPVFSSFRIWSRILFLLTFAVCALAAFGWDALRDARHQRACLRGVAVFSALALPIAAAAWLLARACAAPDSPNLGWFAGSLNNPLDKAAILTALAKNSAQTTLALVPVLAALLWLGAKRLGTGTALVLALAFHVQDQRPVYARFVKFMNPPESADPSQFALPPPPRADQEPWRVFDDNAAFPNRSVVLGYENLAGVESVPMQSFQSIMQAMAGRRRDWLDLMNVRYVFGPPKPGSGRAASIMVNPGAFHRAWLTTKPEAVADDDGAYRLLADPGFDPRTEVALAADPGLRPRPGDAPRTDGILWLDHGPQNASLDVSTGQDAVLVLSDPWYPSWRCAIDGQDTPVLKADGGLQAVVLRAGRHEVDFTFDNGLFYDALAACLAGMVSLVGLAWL